jgi:TatD DNase family protein
MRIADVHCHLQSECFRQDLDQVIHDAAQAGVAVIINASTAPSDWQSCRDISAQYKQCRHAMGIHPWYIPEDGEQYLESISDSEFNGAIAVGEIGLDKKFSSIDFEKQKRVFIKQLDIARSLNLPAVIHCIGAWGELIECLGKISLPRGGIIHNFNGSPELAASLMRKGLSFSLGGTLTYRDSQKRAAMLRSIYPDHLMLETDSPDIPPAEKPKIRNEPAFIRYPLAAAAEILGISEEAVAEITTRNAERMFNLTN